MKPFAKALIALTLVTIATYGLLVGLGMAHLVLGPERLWPFDMRLLGYSEADARAYLSLMSPAQGEFYAGTLRRIDTAFPMLLGLWMGCCLWATTRNLHPWSRVILLVVPASYTVMDLCENALIADLVLGFHTWPDPELVALASSYTVTKFVTLLVAASLVLAMALGHLRRRRG
ncbi:hypothetical protein [Shimia sp.]|uniref:hypothetical protein n=1 Tax=Shimia sp. TaxID=1954381 RepID=UPI0035626FF8